MTTLSKLIELSTGFDRNKAEDVSGGPKMGFDSALYLHTGKFAGRGLELTDHAWSQLATKLGPVVYGKGSTRALPLDYLQRLPEPVMALQLNYWLDRTNGHGFLVRAYQ
jgi:hypothetical protein